MYEYFANVYDELNRKANYKKRSEYVLKLFRLYGEKMPTLLLDLCCGTGEFTKEFVKNKIDVIGVDLSEDMLNIARSKCNSLFICQKASELDLYGTVDGAVCMLDSLNHITSKYELLKTFKKVSLFLEKDKLFIFDVNTVYKHKNILANNAFCFDKEDYFAVWQNETKNNKTEIFIDIFKKNGENYTRYSESFFERAYTDDEIKDFAKKSGFVVLDIFDDLTFLKPNEKSERLYYILKKI